MARKTRTELEAELAQLREEQRQREQSDDEAIAEIEEDVRRHGSPIDREGAEIVGIQAREMKSVFAVRMSGRTLTRLADAAEKRGMSTSALARLYIERSLDAEDSGDIYDRIERMEREIAALRETQVAYQTAQERG